jgi:hypothetical protein
VYSDIDTLLEVKTDTNANERETIVREIRKFGIARGLKRTRPLIRYISTMRTTHSFKLNAINVFWGIFLTVKYVPINFVYNVSFSLCFKPRFRVTISSDNYDTVKLPLECDEERNENSNECEVANFHGQAVDAYAYVWMVQGSSVKISYLTSVQCMTQVLKCYPWK